jgi:methyl-accepting chemotaxis protein
MKNSIRSKSFTIGMVLYLAIILLLSVSSAFYLNRQSEKTNAILKENHFSVVHALDMSENLTNINQDIANFFLTGKNTDSSLLRHELILFDRSLQLEKNNITEPGEGDLVSGLEKGYLIYRDSVINFINSPDQVSGVRYIHNKFDTLYHQLTLLSQMNEKAIEEKTDDAKAYVKKATSQMTFIGTFCFLIAYGFTFIFSSYFNERFYKLYSGIKDVVSSNYNYKLHLDGNDELFELSEIFNGMADKIKGDRQKKEFYLKKDPGKDFKPDDI